MTDNDYKMCREAIFALNYDGSTGAGGVLNQAMFAKTTAILKGNTGVSALVQSMVLKASGGPYAPALNALLAELGGTGIVAPPPPPPPPNPAPVGNVVVGPYGPVDVMTAAEIAAFLPALKAGINLRVSQDMYDRIARELAAGVYSVTDIVIVSQVKDWYWNGGNKDAIRPYLAAVDQRSMVPPDANLPLAFSDPRTVRLGGAAPAVPGPPAGVGDANPPAVPVGGNQRFENVIIDGVLSIGGPPIAADAQIQIHGRGSAEVLMVSNEKGLDAQNPAYPHHTVFSGGNDGGARIIQGGYWGPSGFVRSAPNRPLSILAMDSLGDFSYSQDAFDGDTERSQMFVFKVDRENKKVMLCMMKAGWVWEIRESTSTNSFDKEVL